MVIGPMKASSFYQLGLSGNCSVGTWQTSVLGWGPFWRKSLVFLGGKRGLRLRRVFSKHSKVTESVSKCLTRNRCGTSFEVSFDRLGQPLLTCYTGDATHRVHIDNPHQGEEGSLPDNGMRAQDEVSKLGIGVFLDLYPF